MQRAHQTREQYIGPWLPEPLITTEPDDPHTQVEMQESISLAFLVMLEQLQPFERAVFLLREVFEYEFAQIATMLDKSESACRRSFSRARLHLREQRPRFSASAQSHHQLLSAYMAAVQTGDMSQLMTLLAENVVLWADGGGKIPAAALRPIHGRDAVARISLGSKRFWPASFRVEHKQLNGQTAMIVRNHDRAFAILTVDVDHDQIQTIRIMVNPEKIARI